MENYYKTLPENYVEVYCIDAKDKKTSTLLTVGSLAISAVVFAVVCLFADFRAFMDTLKSGNIWVPYFVFIAGMFGYIILHELVHGIAYKSLTHQKLTFGLTLTVAFCGVPDIYTSRKTALIALAAPFTVFTVLLLPLLIWMGSVSQVYFLIVGFLFAMHLGGCIGDLYGMYLLLFRFKDPRLLMNDTGPKQTFFMPQ